MNFAILLPVFNDWEALEELLKSIDRELNLAGQRATIFIVDDGSTLPAPDLDCSSLKNILELSIVELACNVGHQRAIAIGLCHLHSLSIYDAVVIMDSDGEDRPSDLTRLIGAHIQDSRSVVVAQRAKRSEGILFKVFYRVYTSTFRSLTGRSIDFGNFCLIPRSHLIRLVYMPELWNHLAATILRSRVSVRRVETERGARYAGRSTMNFISLVAHGVSAMSAFADILFVRILVFSLFVGIIAGILSLISVGVRLSTDLAIPGWATTVVGIAFLIIMQGLSLSTIAMLMTMNTRSAAQVVPAAHSGIYVRKVERIFINVR